MAKHVFITGQPGVGKTTLVRNVVERIRAEGSAIISGFYTEELRGAEGRVGFDVVTLSGDRGPLARVGNPKKGEPAVGKYKVDVPAFERLALPQLSLKDQQLVVVDEVGKMELFSRDFIPAVNRLLQDHASSGPVVFGTVPMPRYGRTIPQVEDLKAREDVLVIQITKDTRDQAAEQVYQDLVARLGALKSRDLKMSDGDVSLPATTAPREPSSNPKQRGAIRAVQRSDKLQQPCGPLVAGDPASSPPPRTLLLGLTASPLPEDPAMAYSERSFWKVLDAITGSNAAEQSYQERVSRAAGAGKRRLTSARRQTSEQHGSSQNPNNLAPFLERHPTIDTLAFNGTNAAATARKLMPDLLSNFNVAVLPSSSGANGRMSHQQKVEAWRQILLRP